VRFQRLLGLRNAVTAETLVARVIAIDVSPYFRVARIQLDRGEGLVSRGMPIITPDGVVGRINRVAGDTSDILLSVDPRSAIDVVLPRTGGRGILRGKPGENGYRCAIEYLMQGEQAKEGDLVVTSGLAGFPRDLPVGKVSQGDPQLGRAVAGSGGFARRGLRATLRGAGRGGAGAAPGPEAGTHKALAPGHGLGVYR
jgi:rod shape-determining protein MreC